MEEKVKGRRKFSPEFKISVINEMREGHLGVMEIEKKYCISHSVVIKWQRIYSEKGTDGFMNPKHLRPGRKRKSVVSKPPDFKGDLEAEVQWLRMENEYLKKLRALIQAEDQEKGKRQK